LAREAGARPETLEHRFDDPDLFDSGAVSVAAADDDEILETGFDIRLPTDEVSLDNAFVAEAAPLVSNKTQETLLFEPKEPAPASDGSSESFFPEQDEDPVEKTVIHRREDIPSTPVASEVFSDGLTGEIFVAPTPPGPLHEEPADDVFALSDDGASRLAEPSADATEARVPSEPQSQSPRAFKVASFRKRLLAMLIDAVPIGGAFMLMMLIYDKRLEASRAPLVPHSLDDLSRIYWGLEGGVWLVLLVVAAVTVLYQTFCLAFMRATVGDLVLGMRWVTVTGRAPSPLRAGLRAFALLPSWLLAGVGVYSLLISRTRRTLYDIVSGCYLVDRQDTL
jgi:uncharacterized RDD family membrane protein YckC